MNIPYDYLISLGQIPGVEAIGIAGNINSPKIGKDICKFNENYHFLHQAEVLSIHSTSDLDCQDGYGAQKILLDGLDVTGKKYFEYVYLKGKTPISTKKQFLRINNALVIGSGSLGSNQGDIYIKYKENIQTIIFANDAKDSRATYTVPKNHKLIIGSCYIAIHKNNNEKACGDNVSIQYLIKLPNTNIWIQNTTFSATDYSQSEIKPNMMPPALPELTDIKFTISNLSNNNVEISLAALGYLFNNDIFKNET